MKATKLPANSAAKNLYDFVDFDVEALARMDAASFLRGGARKKIQQTAGTAPENKYLKRCCASDLLSFKDDALQGGFFADVNKSDKGHNQRNAYKVIFAEAVKID